MSLKVGIVDLPNVGPSFAFTEKEATSSAFSANYRELHTIIRKLISGGVKYVS